ncbi:hypothetical protein GGX14DRAFT_568478 [Mycena pura]|uniref:Uncharacterized protein n=1 Tax=Mycena pura TaxID=153505 RepID=A0AAD6Y7Q7_9AGAR|nr:hypothetical protein GGX14DRAFT_568478 [Mycena pura]
MSTYSSSLPVCALLLLPSHLLLLLPMASRSFLAHNPAPEPPQHLAASPLGDWQAAAAAGRHLLSLRLGRIHIEKQAVDGSFSVLIVLGPIPADPQLHGARDILRCNPHFHGAPRFDSVIYDDDESPLPLGEIHFIFRCHLRSDATLDLVQPFRGTTLQLKHRSSMRITYSSNRHGPVRKLPLRTSSSRVHAPQRRDRRAGCPPPPREGRGLLSLKSWSCASCRCSLARGRECCGADVPSLEVVVRSTRARLEPGAHGTPQYLPPFYHGWTAV